MLARLAAAQRGEQHQRQLRAACVRMRRGQLERRPSRACACRGWPGRSGSPASQPCAAPRPASSVSRDGHAPLAPSAAPGCGGWSRCRPRSARACRSARAARRRSRAGSALGSSAHRHADREHGRSSPCRGPALSTHMRPPISSASRLLMARPRPVPPYLRVVEESTWLKDWNRRSMPVRRNADAGVAHGEGAARPGRPAACRRTVTVSTTSPCSVNLTALVSRLSRIWRRRVTSPMMAARHVALEQVGQCRGPSRRPARSTRSSADFDAVAQVEGLRSPAPCLPASILREVEDVVDDRQQRVAAVADGLGEVALLGVQRRVQQQAAHADDGVHRRADLVAHRGQEGALGLVGAFGDWRRLAWAGFLGLGEQPRVAQGHADVGGDGGQQPLVAFVVHAFARRCSAR